MKKIAIEEHFITDKYLTLLRSTRGIPPSRLSRGDSPASKKLLDLGEGRLQQMADDGIDMQVLSLTQPGVQVFDTETGTEIARDINDELSNAIRKYPKKLAGFAAVAPQDPIGAANELERAVLKLGLIGALINSNTNGEYLDQKKYWVIFERAEKLGVPIYIHPIAPPQAMIGPYLAYDGLAEAMCGFAHEVSLHALRLICSGVFDEYPKLNIIIGHMGEALPYWLGRIDRHFMGTSMSQKLKKKPSEYFRENFYITTSGMFWQPPLLCSYSELGADRILFAVDTPYESGQQAVKFIEEAPICNNDIEKICHLNAEKLFRL
jgi:5-carboxyvanillate decarboxylase